MPVLRTVFLTQTYPRHPHDTAGPFIREIALGMVRAGDRVTVLTPHMGGLAERWDDSGIDVRTFRYAPEGMEVIGYSRSLQRDESVRPLAAVATPLYLLGARRAVRRVLGEDPPDVVHAHWIVPNGLACSPLFDPSAARGPILAHGLHGSDVFLAERPVVRSFVRRALARSSVLTGCSPELVARVRELGPVGGAGVVETIPYGIDLRSFDAGPDTHGWRRRLGIPTDAVVVLGVGRMATKKGFQVLVEALGGLFERHPGLFVVLAGGGDREPEFRRRSEPFGGRVLFPGLVERDALPDLYRAADVFCLPAVHDEKGNVDGLPNVILEAMASGLPVVATDVSGIPQAVVDGRTGRLVPEQDPSALGEALSPLLEDGELRKQYGGEGRRRVENSFTWDSVARRYRDAYLEALG